MRRPKTGVTSSTVEAFTGVGKVTRYVSTVTKTRFDMDVEAVERIVKLHAAKTLKREIGDVEIEWDASESFVRGLSVTITERKESVL